MPDNHMKNRTQDRAEVWTENGYQQRIRHSMPYFLTLECLDTKGMPTEMGD